MNLIEWPLLFAQRRFLRDVRNLAWSQVQRVVPCTIRSSYTGFGAWSYLDVKTAIVEISYEMEYRDLIYVAAWSHRLPVLSQRPKDAVILGDGGVNAYDKPVRREFLRWLGSELAKELPHISSGSLREVQRLQGMCTRFPHWDVLPAQRGKPAV